MRTIAVTIIILALGMVAPFAGAAPNGGNRGGSGGGAASRPSAPPQKGGGGFNLNNDTGSRPNGGSRPQGGNGQGGFDLNRDIQGSTPAGNRPGNSGATRPANPPAGNRPSNNPGGSNATGNRTGNGNGNVNVSGNNVNINRNGYGYNGRVVVNPVYRGPAWGWNHGVVWAPHATYWGGGFWGPFAAGVATAVVMGAIVNAANHQTYTSYRVSQDSPGAQLLMNYQLQQVSCGPPGLVEIYGPDNGVICARPNNLVAAGTYAVDIDTLTLQAP